MALQGSGAQRRHFWAFHTLFLVESRRVALRKILGHMSRQLFVLGTYLPTLHAVPAVSARTYVPTYPERLVVKWAYLL